MFIGVYWFKLFSLLMFIGSNITNIELTIEVLIYSIFELHPPSSTIQACRHQPSRNVATGSLSD